jgi:hypothetical protein
MTVMTVPTKTQRRISGRSGTAERMQIKVHVDTEVLDPEIARRRANVWLLETVGNLLGAENAELILDEPLRWRFDVILGLPDLHNPGTGDLFRVGMIEIDATTGVVLNQAQLAQELHTSAAAAVS